MVHERHLALDSSKGSYKYSEFEIQYADRRLAKHANLDAN